MRLIATPSKQKALMHTRARALDDWVPGAVPCTGHVPSWYTYRHSCDCDSLKHSRPPGSGGHSVRLTSALPPGLPASLR